MKILTTVAKALPLDEENGNTLCQDVINKEFENDNIAFQVRDKGDDAPVGRSKITCHLIFDVKMDPTQKAR